MPGLILLRPIFSEKATNVAAGGIYTFEVVGGANKRQIKAAVEAQFGVKVGKVRTANFKPEVKRQARFLGKTKAFKKAIVTLRDGSIDLWAPPEKSKTETGKRKPKKGASEKKEK